MELTTAVDEITQSLGCMPIVPHEKVSDFAYEIIGTFITPIIEIANRIRQHNFRSNLRITDINDALASRRMDPLIGYHSINQVYDYVPLQEDESIYVCDEPQIPLQTYLHRRLPEYPHEKLFKFHWLCIQGIQPKLEENQNDNNEIPNILIEPPPQAAALDQSILLLGVNNQIPTNLKDFFDSLMYSSQNSNASYQTLRSSAAIQPLVPFFLQLIPNCSLYGQQRRMLFYCKLLFLNPSLNMEPYIEHLISFSLSILLTETFNSANDGEDPTAFREESADFLSLIVARYDQTYPHLKIKLLQDLKNTFFSPKSHRNAQYGALLGMQALGNELITEFLLPDLPPFLEALQIELNSIDGIVREKAVRLNGLLFRICAMCLHAETSMHKEGEQPSLSKEKEIMFERLVAFFDYSQMLSFVSAN
ncbi:transcription initiation factor TFIID subunit 6 [Histomonas meleagridis]|uniref:transcription initiation factor TFIID subunit 6 n=1 Tax=Histomonas meleagridis TaxID=135588 RepID=UPI00355AB05A|nr:transcription initiation factor TFIID subunit 6 [Histomonas meleagridis]KAH0799290.1 transcription initiation factor TFIID subunit 6 [Histomonas meleagridis]